MRILVLVFGLATGAAAQAGISASPNPSDNGAYTVSWTAIALATKYQLLEDNRIVYEGGARSKAFSGKTAGSYAYTLTYCRPIGFPVANTVCNLPSNFDAVTVTVNSGTVKPKPPPAPAAPALTAPTSSTTGTYRVTWTKPSGAKTFELQQKVGSASWKGAYAGTAQRKDFSNQGTGAYSYRVRACAGQNNCGDWSATKNTRVTRTTSTISASPNPAPGGDYTVRWTTSALSSGYRLVENVNNGASTNTYNVNGLNKRFEDKAPGTYAYSLRTCFTLFNTVTCVPASGSVTVTVPVATGTISASPKTCTIPAGSNRCTTTVTWSTSNANSPCVFLEASERRFTCGESGSRDAPWITVGGSTFLLKNGNTFAADTLASVSVRGERATVTAKVPGNPAAPAVTAKSSTSLGVTWTAPADNGAAITDYDVQYKTNSASGWNSHTFNGNGTSTTIAGLVPNTTYYVQLLAKNSVGASEWSDSGSAKTKDEAPSPPAEPKVTTAGTTSLGVTWTKPANRGSAISDYDLQYRLDNNNAVWKNHGFTGTATSTTISGLASNTTYQVRVRAQNGKGESPYSSPGKGTTGRLAAPHTFNVPASDADGLFSISWSASTGAARYELQEKLGQGAWSTVYNGASESVDLSEENKYIATYTYQLRACAGDASTSCSSWKTKSIRITGAISADPNTSDDGSYRIWWTRALSAISYILQESTDGGATWSASPALSYQAKEKSFSGKDPGTYTYQILKCVSSGGFPGVSCQSLVPTTVDVQVLAPLAAPTLSLSPNPAPDGKFRATWSKSHSASKYVLRERVDGGVWSEFPAQSSRSRNFSKQVAAVYDYEVKGCDNSKCGGWSATATTRVPPPVPSGLTVPETDADGSYSVTWTAATGADSHVLEENDGDGTWTELTKQTGDTLRSRTVTRVVGVYSYRVRACAGPTNCGDFSATVSVAVPPAVPVVAPGSCRAGKVALSWTDVTGADQYELEQREGSGAWSAAYEGGDTSTSLTLQTGTTYQFRARACAANDNCSNWSATATVTAPDCGPPPPPENLRFEASGPGDYRIRWDAVSGNNVQYELEQSRNNGAWSRQYAGGGLSKSFANRTDGEYRYRVRAKAGNGEFGNYTGALAVTVPIPPPAPDNISVSAPDANGTHTVSWSAVTWGKADVTYKLERRHGTETETLNVSGTSTTVSGKRPGKHTYRVKTCAPSTNCGEWSSTRATATVRPRAPARRTSFAATGRIQPKSRCPFHRPLQKTSPPPRQPRPVTSPSRGTR